MTDCRGFLGTRRLIVLHWCRLYDERINARYKVDSYASDDMVNGERLFLCSVNFRSVSRLVWWACVGTECSHSRGLVVKAGSRREGWVGLVVLVTIGVLALCPERCISGSDSILSTVLAPCDPSLSEVTGRDQGSRSPVFTNSAAEARVSRLAGRPAVGPWRRTPSLCTHQIAVCIKRFHGNWVLATPV